MAEIQKNIIKRGKRNGVSRMFHAKDEKQTIATWRSDLNRILHIFNVCSITPVRPPLTPRSQTELAINTNVTVSVVHHDVLNTQTVVSNTHVIVSELQRHVTNTQTIVSEIHRSIVENQEGTDGKNWSAIPSHYRRTQYLIFTSSTLGEFPPPPPRTCFGREELIDKLVGFAEHLTPIALIGAGGIGKTSIALTVLHHDRIKERFGTNRRFIRCDQFPASRAHFLSCLSKVIGAGVENPEDLTPLRPFLSSKEIIIILDNAESLLDPRGTGAREVSTVVEELSQFETVCLCVTSRISTVPRHCKRPVIPTLSMESACDIFYGIYDDGGRSDIISDLLRQLDFHALSITLLATTASHNVWDYDRLAQEWGTHRTQVLRTDYNESLAATIELSLASPTFLELGPDARDFLSVVAFFPQGVNESNLDWLFPTTSNRKNMLDKFCALSLAYRRNGFVTMLAPLRDHLCPRDPKSSPLLQTTKECYFTRLSVHVDPGISGFEEARWIVSEDTNVEHLLDVFTLVDANSVSVWAACNYFMNHIYWHKPRPVVLGPKIEGLPDGHPSKAQCLVQLSLLFKAVGNNVERKRLLTHSLKLQREEGDDAQVARTLRILSSANRTLGHYKEGIEQAKEALEISQRLNDVPGQVASLDRLARLLHDDKQLDAAEEAVLRAIDLPGKVEEYLASQCHRLLGDIYHSKGKMGMAIKYLEAALEIASPFNWYDELFWIHHSLAELFFGENRFDDAHTHIERAKSYAVNYAYRLGRAMELQTEFWYRERRFEEAKSEALRAIDAYGKIGATKRVEGCKKILRDIEEQMKRPVSSGE